MILVVVMNALFALTFSAGKKALLYSSPLALTLGRTAITAFSLLLFYNLKTQKYPEISTINLFQLFIYSLCLLLSFICGNWALLHVSSIKSALFYATAPLITAIISYLWFNEKFNIYKIAGIIIGLLGIITLNSDYNSLISSFGLPEIVLTIAVISYATGWFVVRPLVTNEHYDPVLINGLASLISCIVCTILIFLTKEIIPTTPEFWFWTSVQALISGSICYSLYMYLLNFYSASLLSFSGFSEPIFAMLYGWLLLGETPTITFWISTILISAGLYLFYLQKQTT